MNPSYTVQERLDAPIAEESKIVSVSGGPVTWRDIATVSVPRRSQRKAVIAAALKEAGVNPDGRRHMHLRVLDARSAKVVTVKARVPSEIEIEID